LETAFKRQKWINLALCFVMIFVCLGFCSANKSLYLAATCEALGVKRTVFSLSSSCRFITTAIVNVFFGVLVAKFGTRKLIGVGFLFLIASVLLKAYSPNVELFYVSEILSGVGFSLSGTGMVGCVVTRWSPENKGTIMGAILCANGIGGAVAAQIVTPMINNEENIFGYQDAYKLVAVLLVVTMLVFLLLFREKPKGRDLQPVAMGKKKRAAGQGWVGVAFEDAVKKPCFYVALMCIFFTGFCLQGLVGISTTHMQDVGLTADYVALMASISALCLTGSKFLSGFLYDKLGLRKASGICCVAAVLCMLSLAAVSASVAGQIGAAVYAVLSAVALPLETVMLPLYAADLFGECSFDKIMGLFISVNTAGYAVGTPFVNLGFDLTGSYRGVLILTAAIMLAVTIAMQFVISAAHKMRTNIPETEVVS
jgi:MFS family permease